MLISPLALFSSALRNYILSHTNGVFETKYQASRIREDLVQAAFGHRTGSDNGPLFASLRNISLSRDVNAPTTISLEEWAEFDNRKDATTIRGAITDAKGRGDHQFIQLLNSRLKSLRLAWGKLKLVDKRQKYFIEADRMRALGQQPPRSTRNLPLNITTRFVRLGNAPMADRISQYYIRNWNGSNVDEDPRRYIHLLRAYQCGFHEANLDIWEDEKLYDEAEEIPESNSKSDNTNYECGNEENSKMNVDDDRVSCILCCNLKFASRKSLTSHYNSHQKQNVFEKEVQCPECQRKGSHQSRVEKGYLAWLNHLERFHGKNCTPYFQQDLVYPKKYPCPSLECDTIWRDIRFNPRGLSIHFTRGHRNKGVPDKKEQFLNPIKCRLCEPETETLIHNIREWRCHFDLTHDKEPGPATYQCLLCQELVRTENGLKSHIMKLHEKREQMFTKLFTCPVCGPTQEIMGKDAWQEHNHQYHNGGKLTDSTSQSLTKLTYLCLFCRKSQRSRTNLTAHLSRDHGEIFSKPFFCPECIRCSKPNTELFQTRDVWLLHVAREHSTCGTTPEVSDGSFGEQLGSTGGHKRPYKRRKLSSTSPCTETITSSSNKEEGQLSSIDTLAPDGDTIPIDPLLLESPIETRDTFTPTSAKNLSSIPLQEIGDSERPLCAPSPTAPIPKSAPDNSQIPAGDTEFRMYF